jgi:outer membrane scaffolding protein for murein synthesis (MipA/OmpV family)
MRRIVFLMLLAPAAHAWDVLDYIRNYDLNDYALGVSYSVSQSPYVGKSNNTIAYPYLTSFTNNAFTDDWLILSNGDVGFRWTNETGWVLGAVGRINTSGTGTDVIDDLVGIDSRKWAVEVAPLIGWRGWPVHLEFKQYYEVFADRGGPTGELMASFPVQMPWGWVIPSATLIHNSAEHNLYYYGVGDAETRPGRPAYVPGSSNNLELGLSIGYAITDKWLLSARVGYEWLDSAITDSPIVDRDALWSANVGIAYNNDIFRSAEHTDKAFTRPGLELRAGLFSSNTDSKIIRRPIDGGPGEEIDMEDVLGINTKKNVMQIDGIYRFAHFHRFEFGYFELGRDSTTTLLTDITIGDETFLQGTEIDVDADLKVTRFAYGFSLMSDSQKELGLLVGVHVSNYDAVIVAEETGQSVSSSLNAPLPVIGAFGSLALGENTDLSASLQIYRMEFNHYDGSLNMLYLGVKHDFTERIGAGIGYNFFSLNLDSPDERLRGSLRLQYHGPLVFAAFSF